jgi:hypothetical protein
LFANFFVSRHSEDRRKANNILHTFVYQLALQDTTFRSSVTRVLVDEPDLLSRPLSHQVSQLLAGPMSYMDASASIVLVLDALDECNTDSQGREGGLLLPLLPQTVSASHIFVKLFVTSRLETSIRKMFNEIQTSSSRSEVLQLHDIDRAIVRDDIRQYLVHSFRTLSTRLQVVDWPSKGELDFVLHRADVLFIYAATVVRYVGHPRFDPRKRLEKLLVGARMGHSSQSASHRQLDVLYQGVLKNAMDEGGAEDESEIIQRLQSVLGTVVLVQQQLSISCLAKLSDWSLHEATVALESLSAVFIVPDRKDASQNEGEDEPVRIFHPSFVDFLLDDTRCTNLRLHIDARRYHTILGVRCLSLINDALHEDSILLQAETDPNAPKPTLTMDLSDEEGRLFEKCIPSHLQYATQHWVNHVKRGSLDDDDLIAALRQFEQLRVYQWFECARKLRIVMDVLSDLDGVVGDLTTVRVVIDTLVDELNACVL